jgi:hypothetical protein
MRVASARVRLRFDRLCIFVFFTSSVSNQYNVICKNPSKNAFSISWGVVALEKPAPESGTIFLAFPAHPFSFSGPRTLTPGPNRASRDFCFFTPSISNQYMSMCGNLSKIGSSTS